MAHILLGCLVATQVLAASPGTASPPTPSPTTAGGVKRLAQRVAADVDAATAAYYQQGLPTARRFVSKPIDGSFLSPADQGNDSYFQALGDQGQTVGFIREFTGPVSTAGLCPCNPLSVTLVFAPDLSLLTVLTRAPLQKWGHAPMTPAEQEQIIAIAKKPPQRLLDTPRGEDLIDATTGATRQAYAPMVVSQAALSTQRLVGVVQDTRSILRGAPASEDRHRLGILLAAHAPPRQLANQLAALLPSMQSVDLQVQVYHYLANTYLEALRQGAEPDASVEQRLLEPHLMHPRGADDVAQACYLIDDSGLRRTWVRSCITRLEKTTVAPPYLALLRGTERFFAEDMAGAFASLQEAAGIFRLEQVPILHWRLAKAAQAIGRKDVACRVAKDLFVVHPMLPKLSEVMAACDNVDQHIEAMRQQTKQTLLRSRHTSGPKTSAVTVRDTQEQARKLQLWDRKKVTVVMFFATWCPHCRSELPRINAYVANLGKHAKTVQVVGIRTAIDKETQTYDQFMQEATPKFPIYSDQPNSSNFAAFAKEQNLPMALPCVAVIDRTGVIRYILEPGDWRDTERELAWAVESLM